MTLRELQATLREHADAVPDEALSGRAAASMRRARTVRRRQALVGGLVAAVLGPLVAAAMLGANPLNRSAPPVHEPEDTPSVEASFAGRELLDSEVAQGDGELTLSRETTGPTQWTASCFGVGRGFTVYMSLDGGSAAQAQCEALEPPEPQMGFVLDRSRPAGTHTLHVWVTRIGSTDIVPVPDVVLTAAVYELPPPVAAIVGRDVYDRELVYGGEWQYVGSRESDPGQRRLSVSLESDENLVAQVAATGAPSQLVRLIVDGVGSDAAEVLDGNGYLHVLIPGRHTVELRITGDVPPSARLGVVWRRVVAP